MREVRARLRRRRCACVFSAGGLWRWALQRWTVVIVGLLVVGEAVLVRDDVRCVCRKNIAGNKASMYIGARLCVCTTTQKTGLGGGSCVLTP